MTPRERVQAALDPSQPDRAPLPGRGTLFGIPLEGWKPFETLKERV